MRGMLCKSVSEPLIELSIFFKVLGAKCLSIEELEQIEAQIPKTPCKLEKVFPPAFFDVMVHLSIHLPNEARIAGPVQYGWMYPIERYLHFLKCFIGNMAHPEGSIVEGYLAVECETGEEQKPMNYYGELTEVLELQFVGERRVILFQCTWFDVYDQKKGVKMDEYGFVDMNPSKTLKYEMGQA
ncbi:hypothetical protein MTR67_044438 [Solanum verrucosum]|uniref:DUF4218 domain-containing protein n=1 Tax=Solanum verrucosum TaxID=315347 RepID=A0AAF0UQJ6_SOLVR|nr:hypothetical protein MTR67_044438 [Solanum verrucosum]